MATTIRDVLAQKGGTVHRIDASATAFDAISKMVEMGVGSLLVTDSGRICGIVTERDFLRRVAVKGLPSQTTLVRDIMTAQVVCVSPGAEVVQCLALMTERRFRHLPVVGDGTVVGLVSIGDLVKQVSSDRKFEVQMLSDYISGKYPG